MSDLTPSKLKVVELRAELQTRGLDTKGNKAVLVQRLEEALSNNDEDTNQVLNTDSNQDEDVDNIEDTKDEDSEAPDKSDEIETDKEDELLDMKDEELGDGGGEDENEKIEEDLEEEAEEELEEEAEEELEEEAEEDLELEEDNEEEADEDAEKVEEMPEAEEASEAVKAETDETITDSKVKKESTDEIKTEALESNVNNSENDESAVNDEDDKDTTIGSGTKRKRSPSPTKCSPNKVNPVTARILEQLNAISDHDDDVIEIKPEEIDDKGFVKLDTYNSDLHLMLDNQGYLGTPLHQDGFAFVWAGARATHGITSGKICFEVKLLKNLDIHLPVPEPSPHVLRIGFSTDDTSMQLGEEPFSYGYGGTAKTSTECKFLDYGKKFEVGDTITAFLKIEDDEIEISYAKNGEHLGVAFSVSSANLKNKALFPHILTKNIVFKVNFGKLAIPFQKLPEGFEDYEFVGNLPEESCVRGTLAPETKADCEVIMMCGLPGSGKTTWAVEHAKKNPEKRYNILGTNSIIDKMRVMNLARKKNYAGRWDVLIQMSTRALNKLLELASKRKRNYILDQTNVYPSAQRRKMRSFQDFRKVAAVIVPSDEEFLKRIEKRENEEGKDIPDSAVLEMKANFGIPHDDDIFQEVLFLELNREEAETLVKQYNSEGQAVVGVPHKRQRLSDTPPSWGPIGAPPLPRQRQRMQGNSGMDSRSRSGSGGGGGGRDHSRNSSPGSDSWSNRNQNSPRSGGGGGGFRGNSRGGGSQDRGYQNRGGFQNRGGGGGGFQNRGGGGGGFRGNMEGYNNNNNNRGGGGGFRGNNNNNRGFSGGGGGGGRNFNDRGNNDRGNSGGRFNDNRGGRGGNDRGGNDRGGRGGNDRGGRGGNDRGGRGGNDRGGRGGYNSQRGGGGGNSYNNDFNNRGSQNRGGGGGGSFGFNNGNQQNAGRQFNNQTNSGGSWNQQQTQGFGGGGGGSGQNYGQQPFSTPGAGSYNSPAANRPSHGMTGGNQNYQQPQQQGVYGSGQTGTQQSYGGGVGSSLGAASGYGSGVAANALNPAAQSAYQQQGGGYDQWSQPQQQQQQQPPQQQLAAANSYGQNQNFQSSYYSSYAQQQQPTYDYNHAK